MVDLMLLKQSESGNRTVATSGPFSSSPSSVPWPRSPLSSSIQALEDARLGSCLVPEQTYELYLDAATSETGGQGSITTIEPNGGKRGAP